MGKKRRYRSVHVNDVNVEILAEAVESERVVLGVDVAKTDFMAAILDESRTVVKTIRWKHPQETRSFLAFVKELAERKQVEIAMEPSGTYGDALRVHLLGLGFPVYRVNPKRSHDAAEVYDGVPSLHDAKSSAIVGTLHIDRRSEPWPFEEAHERVLAAGVRRLEIFGKQFGSHRNRLEGLLSRHWPEVTRYLDLGSATLLELLMEFGGPSRVASSPKRARRLLRRVGGRFLATEKVELVVNSASHTLGVPMLDEEIELVQQVAHEARRSQKVAKKARRHLEKLCAEGGSAGELRPLVGGATSAVLIAAVGDPRNIESAQAYVKSFGLNLKEKSSGKQKGGLHITKRGSGVARLYLYLAVLRLLQRDVVVRAWYAKKVARQGGRQKSKAVVAIMRKLVLAMWYVARGARFDSRLLFDIRRLDLKEDVRAVGEIQAMLQKVQILDAEAMA